MSQSLSTEVSLVEEGEPASQAPFASQPSCMNVDHEDNAKPDDPMEGGHFRSEAATSPPRYSCLATPEKPKCSTENPPPETKQVLFLIDGDQCPFLPGHIESRRDGGRAAVGLISEWVHERLDRATDYTLSVYLFWNFGGMLSALKFNGYNVDATYLREFSYGFQSPYQSFVVDTGPPGHKGLPSEKPFQVVVDTGPRKESADTKVKGAHLRPEIVVRLHADGSQALFDNNIRSSRTKHIFVAISDDQGYENMLGAEVVKKFSGKFSLVQGHTKPRLAFSCPIHSIEGLFRETKLLNSVDSAAPYTPPGRRSELRITPLSPTGFRGLKPRALVHERVVFHSCHFLPPFSQMPHIPNEILSLIIKSHVHDDKDYDDKLSVDPLEGPHIRFGHRHASFIVNLLRINKQFNAVAVDELWKYVSVRTPMSLLSLSSAVSIHGHRTQRLDLRLDRPYPAHLVYEILKYMPRLRVFHMGSHTGALLFHHLAPPTFALAALSNDDPPLARRPRLVRIEFEGSRELPAVVQLRDLLNSNAQLVSLRVRDVAPPSYPIDWNTSVPAVSAPHLRFLSIGYWTPPADSESAGLDSFLTLLCAHPVLLHLECLQVMAFVPSVVTFLHVYGDRLRHLSMAIPEVNSPPPHDPNLIRSCPLLETVVWIVKNCHLLDSDRPLPSFHNNIQCVVLVYCNPFRYIPLDYVPRLQQMLFTILTGSYPSLRQVRLHIKGTSLPALHSAPWFHSLQGEFIKRGVAFTLD
ncbi:hypothetical protein NMY22_g18511 [Coprinellus aureogranulatus]|nr:hypothetical protein NMY22_g18511 [Coprinellus aureogranulatus]